MALLFFICGPGRRVPVLSPGADFVDKALLVLFKLVLAHFQGDHVLGSRFVGLFDAEPPHFFPTFFMLLDGFPEVALLDDGEVPLLALDQVAVSERENV